MNNLRRKFAASKLVSLSMVIGLLLIHPVSQAGGAVIIVPAEDSDLPQGAFIPQQRLEKIQNQLIQSQQTMEAQNLEQSQQQTLQDSPTQSH